MQFSICVFLVLVLWHSISFPVRAATPSGVRSLAGVTAMYVAVEDLNGTTRKIGLKKEQIQAVAETYLNEHNIKLSKTGGNGIPILYLRLSSVVGGDHPQAPISFYLTVQVKQFAQLAQSQSGAAGQDADGTPLLVTTWEDGTMVMTDRAALGFYVRQVLLNVLGEFLHDYQDAKK